jgi:hypothetical protein
MGLVLTLGSSIPALALPTKSLGSVLQVQRSEPHAPHVEAAELLALAPDLHRDVLLRALAATEKAWTAGVHPPHPLLTVIDYSRPSTEKRLWVFDLAQKTLLYHELVAHGAGTGDKVALHFSNRPQSHQSSLGLFLTGDSYVGRNGYSLRLDGLDPGVNCRARERAIVLHGANYVSAEHAREYGRLGRSWGCPAVGSAVARPLIDTIRGGSLLFCYGDDRKWLTATAPVAPARVASSTIAPARVASSTAAPIQ